VLPSAALIAFAARCQSVFPIGSDSLKSGKREPWLRTLEVVAQGFEMTGVSAFPNPTPFARLPFLFKFLLHSLIHKGRGCELAASLLHMADVRQGIFPYPNRKITKSGRENIPHGAGESPLLKTRLH
jgi:hypothetical protein